MPNADDLLRAIILLNGVSIDNCREDVAKTTCLYISLVLVTLVAIFEVGSIVCATAPSSNALIVGRVITGIGGAGITSGALTLINLLVPLQDRPQWTGT